MTLTLTVFILSSISFFIIGFVSGWFSRRRRRERSHDEAIPSPSSRQSVLYEDIDLMQTADDNRNLEMKENVAYGPLKSTAD